MKVQADRDLMDRHRDIIRTDNCKVSEVFEVLLAFCTLGLIVVSSFHNNYEDMGIVYITFFYISIVLYAFTRLYVRNHLQYTNIIMVTVLIEAYSYSFFSGIFFNTDAPSITVYALVVAGCSAYLVSFAFTIGFHSIVGALYCITTLILKPEYGMQDVINYLFFLAMSFVLTRIIYNTRIAYLKSIDEEMKQKELAYEKAELQEQRYTEQLRLNKAARRGAIAIANYNLTQNIVAEYDSSDPALKTLFEHTSADELLGSTKDTILDIEERKKFEVVADTKTMIQAFRNGTTHIEIRHHLKDSTRWMQTTFDMIENPYTGDVEAISGLYDITDIVRSELVVQQLINFDYKSIMLIDIKSQMAFPFRQDEEDDFLREVFELQEKYQNGQLALNEFIKNHTSKETVKQTLRENNMKYVLQKLAKAPNLETIYTLSSLSGVVYLRVIYSYLANEKDTLLCAVQNVTDLYQQEMEQKEKLATALAQAESANRAKTAFLSRVSHDMRTPLNGILGITQLLKEHIADEKGLQDLAELRISGKYLLNLINDTLDVSRIESGKLELHPIVCDGRSVFEKSLALMKTSVRDKNIDFKIHTDNLALPTVYVDPARIDQVVMNVLGNAVKFTPAGGTVTVSINSISFENNIVMEQLVVEDTGIGMSEEFIPHIFEAFSQEDASRLNSYQGTGLGMSITKQILTVMGGNIEVESSLGVGTRITILIPLQCATQEQIQKYKKSQIQENNENYLQHKRILLCEDNELNTAIATRVLEAKGMIVEHAVNGQDGVQLFMDSQLWHFDAVLMDIRMPIMDGLDATKTIRELVREDANKIPIIAMTANAFAEDVQQTKEAGMDAHLSKPIQTELLYYTLEKLMKNND